MIKNYEIYFANSLLKMVGFLNLRTQNFLIINFEKFCAQKISPRGSEIAKDSSFKVIKQIK